MLFPTIEFGGFFVFVYYVSSSIEDRNELRKFFLLLASYFFYASWDAHFLLLLILCSLTNYVLAILIDQNPDGQYSFFNSKISFTLSKKQSHLIFIFGIIFNLSVLGVYKYFNFFSISFVNLFSSLGVHLNAPLLNLALPLGLSFFTFQGISYLSDVHSGKCNSEKSLLNVFLLISFFPHLVSGPIVRASEFLPQLQIDPRDRKVDVSASLLLLLFGLFKKIVLANYLATSLVDPVFDNPSQASTFDAWFATYGYAIQIYCDFSGYSDMAISLAGLLGFRFPENFNQPYRSKSLKEFWRRWHISLSCWLRDYLFIPLGGSKSGAFKTYRNLFLTMILGGLWHGAAWTFLFWGLMHGIGLVFERWRSDRMPECIHCHSNRQNSPFLVFHYVCFSWIFFRSPTLAQAGDFLKAFTNIHQPTQYVTPFTLSLICSGLLLQILPSKLSLKLPDWIGYLPVPMMGLFFGFLLTTLIAMSPNEVSPFIYFKF